MPETRAVRSTTRPWLTRILLTSLFLLPALNMPRPAHALSSGIPLIYAVLYADIIVVGKLTQVETKQIQLRQFDAGLNRQRLIYLDTGLIEAEQTLKLGAHRPGDPLALSSRASPSYRLAFHSTHHPQPDSSDLWISTHITYQEGDEGIWLLKSAPFAERYAATHPAYFLPIDSLEVVNQTIDRTLEALRTMERHDAVDRQIAALQNSNPWTRMYATEVLSSLRPAATEAVDALIAALEDTDSGVRAKAAETLARIQPTTPTGVAALIAGLQDEAAIVRRSAAWALGQMGTEALEAVEALQTALQDTDSQVRTNTARALGQIGPRAWPAVRELTDALQDSNSTVRINAVEALSKIGPPAWRAGPAIIDALQDSNSAVRASAATALGQMGRPPGRAPFKPEGQPAVLALQAALQDEAAEVRNRAEEALRLLQR